LITLPGNRRHIKAPTRLTREQKQAAAEDVQFAKAARVFCQTRRFNLSEFGQKIQNQKLAALIQNVQIVEMFAHLRQISTCSHCCCD